MSVASNYSMRQTPRDLTPPRPPPRFLREWGNLLFPPPIARA